MVKAGVAGGVATEALAAGAAAGAAAAEEAFAAGAAAFAGAACAAFAALAGVVGETSVLMPDETPTRLQGSAIFRLFSGNSRRRFGGRQRSVGAAPVAAVAGAGRQ